MLTPNSPDAALLIPADIYRRDPAVRAFVDLVNDQVPDLDLTVDRAIALAYALAWHEDHGADAGATARQLGELFGYDPEDLAGLLAAGYATLFPAFVPPDLAKQAEAHLG